MNLEILKPILIDFDSLKVGDTLWCIPNGDCVVEKLTNGTAFPIECKCNLKRIEAYTNEGRYYQTDANPSLFKCNPFEWLAAQNNQERVIEVWDGANWMKRVLFMVKNNKAICWEVAETIEDAKKRVCTNTWAEWRELPQTIELTIAEIAEKFGVEPHQIKIHDPNSKA